jgi:hypothetical protein
LRLLLDKNASDMLRGGRQLPGAYTNKSLKLVWKDATSVFNAYKYRSRVRLTDFLAYFEKPNQIPDQQPGKIVNI